MFEIPDVRVQPVEALVPELLESTRPLVNRSQPAGVESVQPLLACLALLQQSDLPKHAQVLGRPRLGHPQLVGQLRHRQLAPRRSTRICRRCGSAIALKTSDVVAALAIIQSYSVIGICQDGDESGRRGATAKAVFRGIETDHPALFNPPA